MKTIKLANFTILAVVVVLSVCVAAWADDAGISDKAETRILNLELTDVSVHEAISAVFNGTGYKYQIQPGVSAQIVTLTLKNAAFDKALRAITDATGLTYTIEDGTYIIGPKKAVAKAQQADAAVAVPPYGRGPADSAEVAALASPQQPEEQVERQPETPQPPPATQVVINQAPAPVFYGHPEQPVQDYGYVPPVYQFGNTRIIGSGIAPVVVAGGSTYILGYGPLPPPPPGAVGPDLMRFLRTQYYIQSRPYFTFPY